jgi:hypothetical protein
MYYLPFVVTTMYLLVAAHKSRIYNKQLPTPSEFRNVCYNLLMIEVAWGVYSLIRPNVDKVSLNIIGFYLAQDFYFYLIHKFLFHRLLYRLHKIHHSVFSPFHTWHCSHIEHLVLNIGSVAFGDFICPIPDWLFPFIVMQQVYTSVNGHTPDSPHSEHHSNPIVHFGNIWIFDKLFG